MEKLKNLINPGSKKDDEVMYGSGRSDDPVHTGHPNREGTNDGPGQGTHFGSSRTTGHDPLSTSSSPTGVSQLKSDTTGPTQYDTATAQGASHGLSEPYASRMPGGFDNDDAATTASVSSGIPGHSQSRLDKSGANDPTFAENPLPHEPGSETGIGHGRSSLTGTSYRDRSAENRSRQGDSSGSFHPSRESTLGTEAVRSSAHRYEDSPRDNYTPETDRSFPLGGSSTFDTHGSSTAGPHSSKLANEADPRVDSDGSRTTGGSDYPSRSDGHGSTTTATHSMDLANKIDPRVDSAGSRTMDNTGHGSTSDDYRPVTSAIRSSGNQGFLGHNTGAGAGAGAGARAEGYGGTRVTGYGPESWQHEHQHHGHEYEGDPCEKGAVDGRGGPQFVSGPHVTDTANRLDPHVGSGFEGVDPPGNSSRHHDHGHHIHRGEKSALAGGAGVAGMGVLEASHHEQGNVGMATPSGLDPSDTDRQRNQTTEDSAYDNNRNTATGASSTGRTVGPHKSDMLNKLDPRVDSDLSKQQGSHGTDHHNGRDAALTGAGGAGLYEAEKHHRANDPNQATLGTTSGISGHSPYGPSVDAVDTTRSGMAKDRSAVSSAGIGHQPATMSDHHHNRGAGAVSAGGIGAYEAEKHLLSSDRPDLAATPQGRLAGSGHQPAIAATSSPYPSSSYSSGSQSQTGAHTERTPLAAGVVGAEASGGGENLQKMRDYGRTEHGTQVREHQHPGASVATYTSPGYSNESEKGHHTSHHTGRDAALVGGAGAEAGALAGHEHLQRHAPGRGNDPSHNDLPSNHTDRYVAVGGDFGHGAGPYEETRRGHHVAKDNSQRDVSDYGAEPYQSTSREHTAGRDAAILGGAAGVGGLAEHEDPNKDAAKLQKEHSKEEKALQKQHLKEIKNHDEELAKRERAHEKAIEKSEKKHEKAIEKDERKHEKAMEKDETKQEPGGKKHGGLLGFLYRDKSEKELKDEELKAGDEETHRQAPIHPGHGGEKEMAPRAGATGTESGRGYDPLQEEHGSQSGVHDNPIEIRSGPTTHDAYGTHDTGHNKLHKDPPSKVIESRGYEFK